MSTESQHLPVVVEALVPFLTDWIDTQRRLRGIPGVQVAIRLGDDLLWSHACGFADLPSRTPLTTEHVFRIASHSKTFTAVAVMQLVERGELRLDDTVAAWLPELVDAPVGRATIRELLGHQSGVERDGGDANFWQLARTFSDRQQLIDEVTRDAVHAPNSWFHYSNLGYSLLGLVIEAVTGTDYREHVRGMLAELGEAALGPDLPVEGAELVSGHSLPGVTTDGATLATEPQVIAPIDTFAESSATGFWGSAEATTAWLSAQRLGNDALLSDASKRLMQRKESTIREGGVTRWYGLGWIMREIGDRTVIGHSGGFPGHITQTWGDPGTGLSVSVLTNRLASPASDWATAIVNLVDKAVAECVDDQTPDVSWAGSFRCLWGGTWLVPVPGKVLSLSPEDADPGTGMTVLTDEDGQLRAADKDGFGDAGEVLRVERDAEGALLSITSTGITSWRADEFERRLPELLSGAALEG